MAQHMVTPPVDPRRLAAAFDMSWLDDAPEAAPADIAATAIDCGTPASNALLDSWNAHVLQRHAADPGRAQALVYRRTPAAGQPGDAPAPAPHAHLAGVTFPEYIDRVAEASVRTWAARMGDAGSGRSRYKPRAAAAQAAPAAAAAPAAGGGAEDEEEVMGAVLQATPTAAQLRAGHEARCETARLLGLGATDDGARAHLHGLLERRQLDDRTNVFTPALQGAVVAGAPDVELAARAFPRPGGDYTLQRQQHPAASSSSSSAPSSMPPAASGGDDAHEVVLRVIVYSPTYVRREAEYLVLGSNTLAQLRDCIYCRSDAHMAQVAERLAGEPGAPAAGASEMPPPTAAAADASASPAPAVAPPPPPPPHQCASFFYIEGALYDDRRPGREMLPSLPSAPPSGGPPRAAGAAADGASSRHSGDHDGGDGSGPDDEHVDAEEAWVVSNPPASKQRKKQRTTKSKGGGGGGGGAHGRSLGAAGSGGSSAPAAAAAAAAAAAPATASELADGPCYLSDNVVAWAGRAETGWGPLQARDMATTTFRALRPRLGAHYLFCHAGDCEHLLIFTDCRLLAAGLGGDLLNARYYPRHVFQARIRRRRCQACEASWACLVGYGDRLADTNPAYFCDHCFGVLHAVSPAGDGAGPWQQLAGPDQPQVYPYTHE